MTFRPSDITREHVLNGLEKINKSNEPLTNGTRWNVIIDGKSYPPKEVMRFAREQYDGSKDWPKGGGWPTNEFLEKMGFEVKEKSLDSFKNIIQKYKELIKINHLKDEKYKWELLNEFKGRPNIDAPDLLEELKSIKYSNLIYAMGSAVLYHLVTAKPDEMRSLFRKLFDENNDLTERIKAFNSASLKIYRNLGETLQHHQDERTIASYLTFYNPEKYTFYKYSFYKKLCGLLNEKQAKKNEKYPHYLQLVHRLIEEYIKNDIELIELVKSYIPEYYDGSNNLLLAQDILYQMLDNNQEVNEINVKEDFIEWMIANLSGGNYFENQFGSSRQRFGAEIHKYEEIYRSEFKSELFIINVTDYNKHIEEISSNIYKKSTPFAEFNENHYSGRPAAILGKKNYLRFLNDYFANKEGYASTITINNEEMKLPLNQILYGPPGTGKTYATKELAVNIVSPFFIKELDTQLSLKEKRKAITKEYDRLFDLGQIVFTTFHQSMSYEDFIEGIKPETNDGELSYDVKKGIFRKLCIKAEEREIMSNNFEESYKLLLKDIDNSDNKSLILETLIQSKEFTIYKNSKNNIKFHANTVKAYEGVIKKELLEHYLKTGEALDWPSYVKALGSYMQEKYKYKQSEEINGSPVVLIIDEINRGNVSAIFGELITLLEEDKRIGEIEELRIKLPYSKDTNFGIPSNLYIIGTMNTADRSVEALDTALRRRFSFSEIMPNPELLEEIQFNGFNLSEVLKTINERIEVLLDRDHTIGHSYFLKVKNGDVRSLKSVFKNNIFPLLQEYFYHDYEKIALILGEGFVRVKENQTVNFAKFKNIDTPEVSTQFELLDKIVDIEVAVHLLLNRNV